MTADTDLELRGVHVGFEETFDAAAFAFGQLSTPEDEVPAAFDPGSPPRRDGRLWALDGVDLAVGAGETVALLGPSGSGKSTLLRVAAGLIKLERPNSGRVLFRGDEWTHVTPRDRRVGLVFQNYALYPHMAGQGNLGFFFRMHKREMEISDRVEETSRVMGVGFDQLLDRKPKTLSGGEQQRVAVGRALVRDPSILLFDEPLSNLDAKLRVRTRVEIKRLLSRFKITALYVTHDQTEAQVFGDRIGVMRAGKIEQLGTYREIYDNPATTFVASFVGMPPMSLVPGTVHQASIRIDGHSLDVNRELLGAHEGKTVQIGLRADAPELLHVDDAGAIRTEIEYMEPQVSEKRMLVSVSLAGATVIVERPLNEEWDRSAPAYLRIPADRTYVFAEDGRRIV